MFQLFHALPRDLQWEVLSVFVGSHSVRKGMLIRKIVRDDRRFQMMEDMAKVRTCHIYLYQKNYHAKTMVCFYNGNQLLYCENPVSGEQGYNFRKRITRNYSWEPKSYALHYTPMAVSKNVPPPYVKNTYTSYLDTDRKKASRHPEFLTLKLPVEEEEEYVPRSPLPLD